MHIAKEDFEAAIEFHGEYLDLSTNYTIELQRANTQLGKSYYDFARHTLNYHQKSSHLVKRLVSCVFPNLCKVVSFTKIEHQLEKYL